MKPRPAPGRRVLSTSPFTAPTVEAATYDVGDRVTSDRHGLGRVISVQTDPQDGRDNLVVDFRGGNLRRITLPSSTLSKLED